jgi:glutathione synthase/RimK-type ligase-like ATP-grasp enzyme
MVQTECMLVTCASVPDLDPDDRTLLSHLERRGIHTSIGVWSDPSVDWSRPSLCILRSTWDYHVQYARFMRWLERDVPAAVLRNDPAQVRWSSDKRYLAELISSSIPVVPTSFVNLGSVLDLQSLAASRGWTSVVIKPSRGAAGCGVLHVGGTGDTFERGQEHVNQLIKTQDVLIQPYLDSVRRYGERALVFFHNNFSHAVIKKPFDTVLAVSADRSMRVTPTSEEMSVASAALRVVPGCPLYARVDLLRGNAGEVLVNEVELIEPALYLKLGENAAGAFADAIEAEIRISLRSARHQMAT